jgi:hypothetical protein
MALKIIRILRAPKSAFDKDREVSTLLKSQVAHMVEAEQRLPASKRTGVKAESITTEHEAAEYVGKVMKRLYPKARKAWRLPPGARAPNSGAWLGPARMTGGRGRTGGKDRPPKRKARRRGRNAGKKR